MNKKDMIIDALRELFIEGKAGTASVSDIAKKAGIAKGGMYYYFRSKEEVLDALIAREYAERITACTGLVTRSEANAVEKLALLLESYHRFYIDPSLDEYLHLPENAAIHQKSLAQILLTLSPLIAGILEQGCKEGLFTTEYPQETAEILMSAFTFLLDPGIFPWSEQQLHLKRKALAQLLEKGLGTAPDTFAFLWAKP